MNWIKRIIYLLIYNIYEEKRTYMNIGKIAVWAKFNNTFLFSESYFESS